MSPKTIVITGASSGIGAALAELLASQGHSLVLVARREPELHAVAARCGPLALPVVADVTSRDDVQRVVRSAIERFDHIDVWVNNAGRGMTRMPSELTDDDIDEMMRVNVKSALYGMQEVLPHFKERGTGHVINVSSMLGRIHIAPFRSAYSGAKHFLSSLTADMRADVQGTHPGIQISLFSPGVVQTEFGVNATHGGPDSRTLPNSQPAEDVAAVIAQMIGTRKADAYSRPGAVQMVLKYFTALDEA